MQVLSLPDKEFIRVSGADTLKFLQGQVSCDMQALDDSNSLRGALCNLKGRVIADFRIIKDGDDCLLQTNAGMAEKLLAVLGKYAVFSKVELTRDESVPTVLGILGEPDANTLPEKIGLLPENKDDLVSVGSKLWLIRLPGTLPRYEAWCLNTETARLLANGADKASLAQWQEQDIVSGIYHVTPETSEEFTPQLLNYDISGVINFRKGCYTGQEVVARMYFRSTAKKRLAALRVDEPVKLTDSLVCSTAGQDKKFSLLACCQIEAATEDYSVLLAVLDVECIADAGSLSLTSAPEAAISVLALPYADTRH